MGMGEGVWGLTNKQTNKQLVAHQLDNNDINGDDDIYGDVMTTTTTCLFLKIIIY